MQTAHGTARADFDKPLFKLSMNARILVLVLHLRAALLHIFIHAIEFSEAFEFSAAGPQRQVTRRFIAGVKMLVKPEIRRHHYSSGLPVEAFDLLSLRP